VREPLRHAYLHAAPALASDGPMHPASSLQDQDLDWQDEMAARAGLTAAEPRLYDRAQTRSARDDVGFISTTSEVRLLPDDQRASLSVAVTKVIEANGGWLTLPLRTRPWVAHRY
jgi:hypothetical protein